MLEGGVLLELMVVQTLPIQSELEKKRYNNNLQIFVALFITIISYITKILNRNLYSLVQEGIILMPRAGTRWEWSTLITLILVSMHLTGRYKHGDSF